MTEESRPASSTRCRGHRSPAAIIPLKERREWQPVRTGTRSVKFKTSQAHGVVLAFDIEGLVSLAQRNGCVIDDDLCADTWTETFEPCPIRVEKTRPRSPTVRPRPIWEIRANPMAPSREGELWKRHSGADGRISSVVPTGR